MTEFTLDELVKNFIACRDKKATIEGKTKVEVARINNVMNQLTGLIMKGLEEQGLESIRTKFGTAYKTPKTQVSVADWDTVLAYVKENGMWNLLTKGVSKTVVEEILDKTKALPPGVNYRTEYDVNVRAS